MRRPDIQPRAAVVLYGDGSRPNTYPTGRAAGALVLELAHVTLEIRRFVYGPMPVDGIAIDLERYIYSIARLVFGAILLSIGIAVNSSGRGRRRPRDRADDSASLPS